MFKKIVTDLSLSPSSIAQLADYAKRVKKQRKIYSLSLVFLIITLIIHSFVIINPTTSSNSAHQNDTIYGGVRSVEELLQHYDTNEAGIVEILNSLEISREDLVGVQDSTVTIEDQLITGRTPLVAENRGERAQTQEDYDLYVHPASSVYAQGAHLSALQGTHTYGQFYILKNSGNIILENIFVLDTIDTPLEVNITAHNDTQGLAASDTVAEPNDRITYTLHISASDSYTSELRHYIGDLLEYSALVDNGGAVPMTDEGYLTWYNLDLAADERTSLQYTVQVADPIPTSATGVSAPQSYDCIMTAAAHNSVSVPVSCPITKQLEHIVRELPPVNPPYSIVGLLVVFTVTFYLYIRARIIEKELRIIRHKVNTGSLS